LSQFISEYYSWIVLTFAAATIVSLIALAVYYRQSRRASFFFMRVEASRRARYIFWGFLALAGVTITLLLTPPRDSPTGRRLAATPVAAPPTPAANVPTETPAVAVSVPSPAATPLLTPTPTLSPTPSPTPITGPVQGASFSDLILARGITGDNRPLSPTDTFLEGGKPVYLFFQHQGMNRELHWTQVWFKGTTELFRETVSWEWGEAGMAWVFFTPDGGYTPGEYEVQLYIENNLQESARFSVK
jgi:hypothetical protein